MSRRNPARRLRSRLDRLYRKYRAVLILTNSLSADECQRMDKSLASVQRMGVDELRARLPEIEKETKALCKKYGVLGELADLEKCMPAEDDRPPIVFIAKFALQELFSHYERRLPIFPDLPPHARIGVEYQGTREKSQVEVFILEASLYEDMAALWNAGLRLDQALQDEYQKEEKKQLNALARATAKAAFNLVEGYLNSLALDILLTRATTPDEEALLTEWDSDESKPRFLTLRDKLLQYPKVALGLKHPPLTESNCPEIARIVELESSLRHSLIHPTPQSSLRDPAIHREQIYLLVSMSEAAELCDLALDLVVRISDALSGMFGDVNKLWLQRRDETGYFPPDVFR